MWAVKGKSYPPSYIVFDIIEKQTRRSFRFDWNVFNDYKG